MRGRIAAVGLLLAAVGLAGCGQAEPQIQETLQGTTALPSPTTGFVPKQDILTVTKPQPNALAFSPLHVTGTTTSFEVLVAVCDANGNALARQIIAGAGDAGPLTAFDASVAFSAPATTTGVLVYNGNTVEGGPARPSCLQDVRSIPLRFAGFTG